jgi:hypothetical protein
VNVNGFKEGESVELEGEEQGHFAEPGMPSFGNNLVLLIYKHGLTLFLQMHSIVYIISRVVGTMTLQDLNGGKIQWVICSLTY